MALFGAPMPNMSRQRTMQMGGGPNPLQGGNPNPMQGNIPNRMGMGGGQDIFKAPNQMPIGPSFNPMMQQGMQRQPMQQPIGPSPNSMGGMNQRGLLQNPTSRGQGMFQRQQPAYRSIFG